MKGTFTLHEAKGHPVSNAPCPEEAFCAAGSLADFGPATITILSDTFEEIEGSSCLATTRVEQIELLSGAGTLTIDSSGTVCGPGHSFESHAGPSSFGHPVRFALAFTVDGGSSTGVFAGASGSGTEEMSFNGGVGRWRIGGTVLLV